MNGKPTVNDIARQAGVSLATVDRVLNTRPGVRTVTIERVQKAINELGYIRDTAAANLARQRLYQLAFVLPDSDDEFIRALADQIQTQAKPLLNERTTLHLHAVNGYNSQAIANKLDSLATNNIDGIALLAAETPAVRDAISRARERGVVVVALLADLPSSGRDHFIGINNTAAGGTAAKLMGRFIHESAGCIVVLTGSRLARDHLERRHGFDTVMAAHFPHLQVLPSIDARNDSALIHKSLTNAFSWRNNIRGIYASGTDHSGLINFLQNDLTQKNNHQIVVIAHELTALSRRALEHGVFDALISQDTGHIVRSAIRLMRATADASPINATQERIRIDVFLTENLPPS